MPTELLAALFKRRENVDNAGEHWESKPERSSADAGPSHLAGLEFDAPAMQEWLRSQEKTPEEDSLEEALAEEVAGRSGTTAPAHAPDLAEITPEDVARLQEMGQQFAAAKAEFEKEREQLGTAREEVAKREAELREREQALQQLRDEQQAREESRRNYPLPDWLPKPSGQINIGVVGNAGVGKSLLINKLRRLRPGAEGWAPVGVNETTMTPTMYEFPGARNVRIWDLPGSGTEAFPSETYIQKMGIRYFDKVIIVTAGRFTSTEVALKKELENHTVPYYMVRTKIDIDVWNNREDNRLDEQTTLAQITEDLETHGVKNAFLVSSRDTEAFDMTKLMEKLFPGWRNRLDPSAPSFCPAVPSWNDAWAVTPDYSQVVAGLQGRWYDAYGATYHICGLEAHVSISGRIMGAIVRMQEMEEKVYWLGRWWLSRDEVNRARWNRELRWHNIRPTDQPLFWWWSD